MTLRLRVLPRYPARIQAASGLKVVRQDADLVILPDFGSLVQVPFVSNTEKILFLSWDKDTNYYQSISFADFVANIQGTVIGPTLTAIDITNPGANQVVYFSGPDIASLYEVSAYFRGISNASDLTALKTLLALQNVTNTSDVNKPVSTAQQAAIDAVAAAKADKVRTISGGGIATGGGDLSADRTITVTKSTNAQAVAGTDDTTAMTPARVKDSVLTFATFTKSYDSGQQVITAGGSLSLAHGLGAAPKLICTYLECASANNGFSSGDVVHLGSTVIDQSANTSRGAVVQATSTQILVTYGNVATTFAMMNPSTGTIFNITNSQWRYRVRAYN